MKLKNKVCVVTGGAMGNGLGIVKVFLKYGAKVSIIDYDESINDIVVKLNNEGYNVIGFYADIRDKEKVDEAIFKTKEIFGNIDVLVNNAGVAKLQTFMEMSDEVRDFHFDVNIKGTWNVTKSCLKYFNDNGSIVNLSSVTGPMVADTGECAYATTKAALIGFTKGLAMELVSRNIRVNAIMPGYIMTPMVDGIAKESNSSDPKSVIEGIRIGIPMKRLGTIEELGELAAFLASDESSYITGQGIVIDGGSTLPETMSVGA
ncbi:MAG: SDR family oxidoreductase UcpA [Bacilli bacterium]|nr:SDR family oxidoreductase UcpA [Mollicutes bacterium]